MIEIVYDYDGTSDNIELFRGEFQDALAYARRLKEMGCMNIGILENGKWVWFIR